MSFALTRWKLDFKRSSDQATSPIVREGHVNDCLPGFHTQHVANIHYNGSGFGRQGGKTITRSIAGVRCPAWANLESILTVPLEEKGETANICVSACSPCASGVLRWGVMYKPQLCQAIRLCRIIGCDQKVFIEAESDRETRHCIKLVR
jgi:hypothetical protein